MKKRSCWVLLVCIVLFSAACEQTNQSASESTQSAALPGLPTRTVKPIVSYTPRFTATPIPSVTLTPSNTPEPTNTFVPPTLTLTPSPTATPIVPGVIASASDRVNLRESPEANARIVASVPRGTDVGVLSLITDDNGFDWYEVVYTPEDGEPQRLWVRADLVDTDYQTVVAAVPTTAPNTPGTASTLDRTPGPTPVPNSINILAYCIEKGEAPSTPTTNDNVYIWWSWYVTREEYMEPHLKNATYTVRLDGEKLENWANYASEMKQEGGLWFVYWYYPVGKLSAGEHEVTYLLSWDEAITDGYDDFGPGTDQEVNEGHCTFTVREP